MERETDDGAARPASPGLLRLLIPGLLVAATGVGAGDLATSALVGAALGPAVLWAVLAGCGLKLALNEGLARFQLATGDTLLEGAVRRFGWTARLLFGLYLLPWSFFVGSALMGACGVTLHAMLPVFDDAAAGKLAFGALHSAAGALLVLLGGFRAFEKVMAACVGLMVAAVVAAAAVEHPPWTQVLAGFVPTVPEGAEAARLTVALMGGIGGTLTVLCYGYWIRAEGREGPGWLRACRIDLATGYAVTALFGAAMVVVGSSVRVEGGGATLVVRLADQLEATLGPAGRWAFLLGAWGAVFSSVLGVWQAVPLVFADWWRLLRRDPGPLPPAGELERSAPARAYLVALATVPVLGLLVSFRQVQLAYAVIGACFMPLLAATLLVLNGRSLPVPALRNGWPMRVVLVLTLLFFAWYGVQELGDG